MKILATLTITYMFLSVNAMGFESKSSTVLPTVKIVPIEAKLSDFYPPKIETKITEELPFGVKPLEPKLSLDYKPSPQIDPFERFEASESEKKEAAEVLVLRHNLSLDKICQNLKKELRKESIAVVEKSENADLVITVEIKKMMQLAYSDRPIIEQVTALGSIEGKQLLYIDFKQVKGYIDFRFWKITKASEQIGTILGKKIAREIKKLN